MFLKEVNRSAVVKQWEEVLVIRGGAVRPPAGRGFPGTPAQAAFCPARQGSSLQMAPYTREHDEQPASA